MKNRKKWILVAVVAVVVVVAALLIFGGKGEFELAVSTQEAEMGQIENSVTATGEIQPVYKVEVGTQVSGIVKRLYVDYNSEVKKGDLLAELDKSTLNEQVKQSKARLSTARSSRDLAQKNFDRVKSLFEKKAATQEEYDQYESQLESAKNDFVTAQSNYENALTNLKYAEIYSPIDGVVLGKEVEEGQTVASSFSTPTLFTIANDLTRMQVEADVDEADIGQVKVGQRVTFTVDAYPKDVFDGTVRQIRLDATVTNNVVTYKVIIDAPNPDGKLYPGMTANVTIIVEQQEGVTIPLEATFMEMNPEVVKFAQKKGYEIEEMKGPAPKDKKVVYVLEGKKIRPMVVTAGLDDGAKMIVDSSVAVGTKVVLSMSKAAKMKAEAESADNPFMMGPPEQKKR